MNLYDLMRRAVGAEAEEVTQICLAWHSEASEAGSGLSVSDWWAMFQFFGFLFYLLYHYGARAREKLARIWGLLRFAAVLAVNRGGLQIQPRGQDQSLPPPEVALDLD